MNNNSKAKNSFIQAIGIPSAVLFAYICALCALPSSDLLTSFPIAALLAVITSFICKNRKLIYISMAVMNLLTTVLMGYELKRGVISALVAAVSAYLAILAKRAFVTVKKSNDEGVKSKSKLVLIISVVLCVAVWLICCGNPVSFIIAQNKNIETAEAKYPDKVDTGATFFDVTRFEYVTEITFNTGVTGERYYISAKKNDDYMGFHMSETLLDAADYFSGQTALPAEALNCYIDTDEFIFGQSRENNENYKNTEYLMQRAETVTGMKSFSDLYESLTMYAKQSEDLVYKSFIMTAKDMNGKTYYALKEYGKDVVFSIDNFELAKIISEKFN